MSRRSLNFGPSFDEIISILPSGISNSFANSNETKNDEPKAEDANEKTQNNNNLSELAFISAIYNTLAITIFFVCLGLCALLLIVLQAFVRSILWALLTSAFLFTFKKYLTDWARNRLTIIEKNEATLALELVLLPAKLVDDAVDSIWSFFKYKYKNLLILALAIGLFHLASSFYQSLFDFSITSISTLNKTTNLMSYYADNSWQITFTIVIVYLFTISFYWREEREYQLAFQLLSVPVWFSVYFLISKLLGSYSPLFTVIFFFLTCLGTYSFIYEYIMKYNQRLLQSTDESNDDDNNDTMTSSCTEDASRTLNENEIENLSSSTHSSDSVMNKNVTDSAIESNLEHSFSARLSSLVKNSLHSVAHYSYLLLIKLYYKYTVIKENQNNETHKKSNRSKSKFNLSIRLKRKKENSDKYFILLFWLFICVKLRYDLYIAIPVIVIIWKLLKLAFKNVYCIIFESENVKYYMGVIYKGFERRRAVLAPEPFVLLIKLFTRGDHKVNQLLQKSIDSLISGLMIIALLLFVITSVIVLAMQVHSESVQFISIASNILNERVYAKPELREWLPEKEKLNKLYQASMNNLYLYGRESLSKMLRSSSINDANSGNQANYNKTEYLILEAQILNQFDILYAYLSQKASSNFNFTSMNNSASNLIQNSTNSSVYLLDVPPISVPPKNKENPIQSSTRSIGTQTPKGGSSFLNINSVWNLKEALSSLKSDSFDYKQLAIMVKNNFGLLVSVMDSVYLIVKGNVNLLTTILYTVLSILFSSGFALVNFIFSLIVYITALFYLLSMSRTRYKPFQWLTEISVFKNQNESSINKSQLLIKVIEESIRSVFVASLKMAAFYGIYTYIVYSLFSVSIVYLPSIVAALLAFLPIIGTYWTCIPGVLELWLIHNKPLNAIIFVIMHFLPFTVGVDKAIYCEIRGGHPYLTGRFAKY